MPNNPSFVPTPKAVTTDVWHSVQAMICERELILVTGKGGVGKSTIAGAVARLAAQSHGAAAAVEMSAHPQLPSVLHNVANVSIFNIQLEEAMPRALGRLLHVPAILGAALNNRVLRLFAKTSPAVAEMVVLDELYALVQRFSKLGHPVVVDLPASGHALSLLRTPRAVQRMLRVGPVAERSRQIEKLLTDPKRCEVLVVAIPEELPVNETIELVAQVQAAGLHCRVVVINQVPDTLVQEDDRNLLGQLHNSVDTDVHQVATLARGELDGAHQARSLIAHLQQRVHCAVVEVPLSTARGVAQRTQLVAQSISTNTTVQASSQS